MNRRAARRHAARLAVLVAGLLIAGCDGSDPNGAAAGTLASSAPPGTSSTSITPVTTTSTTVASTTTTSTTAFTTTTFTTTTRAAGDPSYDDIPVGVCDTITTGAIGYRNETGRLATQYVQIGTSFQGRPIWAEHWGAEDGPQVLVLGQVHGDECAPAWFVQAIREQPPSTFGIWLVPTANPDGLAAGTRLTAQGIDPNRDGFLLETPEAHAVMDAAQRFQPVLTIHVHSPYQWIGSYNGGIASEVAQAMMTAVGWPGAYSAGRVGDGDRAFLWEGQERVIPGHPSVLIEFPAVAEAESPAPPDPSQKHVTSVGDVAKLAVLMRDALYGVFGRV